MSTAVTAQLELPVAPEPGRKLLYVALHGLVALVESPTEIHALMLRMTDEHAYRAGSWLAEKNVPIGSHGRLRGVKNGGTGLNPDLNPVLRMDRMPNLNHPDIHGSIVMPKPRRIHYLDRGKITITDGAVDRLLARPSFLSGLRVLEFEIESTFGYVLLSGMSLNWTADKKLTNFDNGSAIATFHLFDMPAGAVSDYHHVEEFALSSSVLGFPIGIGEDVIIPKEPQLPPPGMALLELGGLDERENEISDLFTDWIRLGKWTPSAALGEGGCRPCCGSVDGFLN